MKADLNGSLFVNAKQQKETGTGAWSYINQNGYASGNGRLLFKTTQTSKDKKNASDVTGSNNSNIWGDSYCDHTESAVETWEATAAKALAWAAAIPNGDSVQAMVVSDYIFDSVRVFTFGVRVFTFGLHKPSGYANNACVRRCKEQIMYRRN